MTWALESIWGGADGFKFAFGEVDPLVERAVAFLGREAALDLGESPWPTYESDQDIQMVNWAALCPEGLRPQQKEGVDGFDLEPRNDPWPFDARHADDLTSLIREVATRGAREVLGTEPKPHAGWDVCAWYQPIHFFGHDWGIFVREEYLTAHAIEILRHMRFPGPVPNSAIPHIYKSLLRASFLALYLHEHYHHKTESLGFRLHIAHRATAYLPYHRLVYRPNVGKDTLIEEALANADAYQRLNTEPYKNWIWRPVLDATRVWLKRSFPHDPPGYRMASRYLAKPAFASAENTLQAQMRDASITPKSPAEDWDLAPRMAQSVFTIRNDIWTVVPAGSHPVVPVTAPPKTCSTDAMVKLLQTFGYAVVPGGKGSHIKLKKADSPTMILPGNRKDLSPGVIRNVLRGLGDYAMKDLTDLLILHT